MNTGTVPKGIAEEEEFEFDDGTQDDCPTCGNIYANCACGQDSDEANW